MTTYNIDYGMGIEQEIEAEDFEAAKAIADERSSYSQRSYSVTNEDGSETATRSWVGVEYDDENDDCEDPIRFGAYGYYADWQEE